MANFGSEFDRLETRMEPEVRIRAQALDQDEEEAVAEFKRTIQLYRDHLKGRRAFVLEQDEIKALSQ